MKVRFFPVTLALAITTLLLPVPPTAGAVNTDPSTIQYRVSVSPGDGKMEVELDFQAEGTGVTLITSFKNLGEVAVLYPPGYFRIIQATGPGGEELDTTPVAEGWEIKGAGHIQLEYEIDIGLLTESVSVKELTLDSGISPYLPRLTGDYFYVPGFYLLLYPQNQLEKSLFEISFQLPPGWQLSQPWGEGGAPGLTALLNGFFGGNLSIFSADGEPRLVVAQGGNSDLVNLNSQKEFTSIMRRVIDEARGAWGGLFAGDTQLLICLATMEAEESRARQSPYPRQPLLDSAFLAIGEGENILSEDFLGRAGGELLRVLLGRLNYAPEALWLREGAIGYYRLLLPFRAGLQGASALWDQINEIYLQYLGANQSARLTLAECGKITPGVEEEARLLGQGGTIALASLDSLVSEQGKSVDDLFRALSRRQDEEGGAEITNHTVEEILQELTGVDYSWFFKQHIQGKRDIPASCFSRLKIASEPQGGKEETSPEPPKSHFNLVIFILALLLVFALPFLLEPYALRPRASAVPVEEEEDDEDEGEEKG